MTKKKQVSKRRSLNDYLIIGRGYSLAAVASGSPMRKYIINVNKVYHAHNIEEALSLVEEEYIEFKLDEYHKIKQQ